MMIKNIVTEETLKDLQKGNHKAFDIIFLTYFENVKNFIDRIIRSSVDAEELAQEVFFKIWNKRETIDTKSTIAQLIFVIARNDAFSYIRNKRVEKEYIANCQPLVDELVDYEESIFVEESKLLIEMKIALMPPKQREAIDLKFQQGFSNEEISEKMGITSKTVRNYLHQARLEIKQLLNTLNSILL